MRNILLKISILICLLFIQCSISSFAQTLKIERTSVSQDEFRTLIFEMFENFEQRKIEEKKLPKLTKADLEEIISAVPFTQDGKFEISHIVKVENINKSDLYNKVYQAIVDVFVNAQNVIQMQDKENGIIVCKGLCIGNFIYKFGIMGTSAGKEAVSFTLKIQCKDGRYKIDIYDVNTQIGVHKFLDSGLPIESYLIPEFYDTSYGEKALKQERSDEYYINIRTQLLLDQLYQLYKIEETIQSYATKHSTDEDNW